MLRRFVQVGARQVARAQSTAAAQEKWDLYAGVLVERLPVVSKSLSPVEKQFQDLLWRIEFENSLKSDHELKNERELVQAELIKQGKVQVDLDDSMTKQTAQDLKDAYVEELKKFQLGSRTTPDDAANKTSSTDRCLEDTLYLLVQQKLGQQQHMILPQGKRQDGESMRQTAERVLREQCGSELQVLFYGNAPVGYHKYKYPSNQRAESVGAKVFFYRASLLNGQVWDKKTPAPKYEWLPKAALDGKLTNAAYADSIKKFLL
ncbi:39S ribosomal protein L46, mitochondrial [Drosophila guanche]|uniref:Large ribosomal subunit protein mL46 n=1 Tax=Drosophila guanche TaxID=7266 RepID=A0A3B0KAT9_DROGU|nr:39S ribosomal protein L46, mitochondrial [Drosophila guanche]SPP85250.1 blast:39S ribosomal protein L46%2C mitochondrial [Drosophila guanche]